MMDSIFLLPAALALLALSTRSLDYKGAISALLMGLLVLVAQNIYWLSMLLVFFVVGTAATKVKAEHKKQFGFYQKTRTTENVVANGGVALLMALAGNLYGFLGALSTATADTLSSELGVLSKKRPVLITTLRPVKTGTDGAVSLFGTVAEIGGVFIIVLFVLLFNMSNAFGNIDIWKITLVTVLSGIFGCTIDSFVGATWERRGISDNSKTNFMATASGGLFALLLGYLL